MSIPVLPSGLGAVSRAPSPAPRDPGFLLVCVLALATIAYLAFSKPVAPVVVQPAPPAVQPAPEPEPSPCNGGRCPYTPRRAAPTSFSVKCPWCQQAVGINLPATNVAKYTVTCQQCFNRLTIFPDTTGITIEAAKGAAKAEAKPAVPKK